MFHGRFFICADIHGDAQVVKNLIAQVPNPNEEDTIIVCGDAGFEYGYVNSTAAKRAARKFPGNWIVLRGNHDSCYWKDHEDDPDWDILEGIGGADLLFENIYPNILYVKDSGGIYNFGGLNFLMLPGAYSVDKAYRLRNRLPYNEDEQLDDNTMLELYQIVDQWNRQRFNIDYVIGHTFPKFMEPYFRDLFFSGIDQRFVDKRTEMWLSDMANLYEGNRAFKQYYGGHFHDSRTMGQYYTMVYHKLVELEGYNER